MNARRENFVSWFFVIGIVMLVGSILLIIAMPAYGIMLLLLAVVLIVVGIVLGLAFNRAGNTGPVQEREAFVVSRYAINQIGEMIFSNYEFDAEGGRFYVRLQFPDGHHEECECAYPVFQYACEGMRGRVVLKGRWLGQFTPLPRPV